MRSIVVAVLSLILSAAIVTVSGQDSEALVEYCAQPQNREVCEQLLASLIAEEQDALPQIDKRKPSFVRFGKRALVLEKRKPSFVRFGRK
ncbi:unnamed protein product [Cylicocyclus nassatus]|uniref:Uncharacterized protein n=1 Tax=Cylicocyclus nassatus TaxID=53992 RepID=A0AA36H169_CYLNA|nr:unnamed protein product [Cylicocyclus nassatus]